MDGIINVLKPPGMTSNDVIVYIRKKLKIKKAGHTGTLDPGAAGVLPVCVGKATKIADYIKAEKKTYICEIKLGNATDTYDRYGKLIYEKDREINIDLNKFQDVLNSFVGDIVQVPPIYSAIKVSGKKLYDYARHGIAVEIPKKNVTIYSIDVRYYKPPVCLFEVTCSKGTYIRSLCNDIGEKIGCSAYMNFLLRVKTGVFDIKDSVTLEEITEDNAQNYIIKMDSILDFDKVFVPECNTKAILNGNPVNLDIKQISNKENPVLIYLYPDKFVGIGNIKNSVLYVEKLLV